MRSAPSSSHPIGRRSVVLISGTHGQPSATRLRAQRPARHTTGGECHQQQHCLGGLFSEATRFDRARPGRPTHGLVHGLDLARLGSDRPRHRCYGPVYADDCGLTAAIAAPTAHTGWSASSSDCPLGWCGVVLVSDTYCQPPAMKLQAHGLLDMLRVANAFDSSTVSRGSERRRSRTDRARPGGPYHGPHLRPRLGVLDGLRRAAATPHFC